MLKNLVKIENLTKDDIWEISELALKYKKTSIHPSFPNEFACLMFFENSTRTKISFDVAAQKLGIKVINFNNSTSSLKKGESFKETIENLCYIGINSFIIRTSDDNLIANALEEVSYPVHFINAGSGKTSHPTQALLDFVTMREKFNTLENKKVTIVGDIEHSRVAKSNIALLKNFGVNITICAPLYFKPETSFDNVYYTDDVKEAVESADIVMGLRIQKERLVEEFNQEHYVANYKLTSELLNKYAPNAILMHPGPVNRELDMSSELLESEKGKTILEQARNGVYTRMAVLSKILGGCE